MKAIFDVPACAAGFIRAESAGEAVCDAAPPSRRMRTTTPTKVTSAATAQYVRCRRRVSRLASSISASTRASISSRSSGLLSGAVRAGEGGRGGAEIVMRAYHPTLS